MRSTLRGAAWAAGRPLILAVLAWSLPVMIAAAGDDEDAQAPQRRQPANLAGGRVYKARIEPHWFENNTRFWYRNDLRGGGREFVLVDAEQGTRAAAFDHARLAAALGAAAGKEYRAERLPLERIEFVDSGRAIVFEAAGQRWKCDLSTYECAPLAGPKEEPAEPTRPPEKGAESPGSREAEPEEAESSPQAPQGPRRPGFGRGAEFAEAGRPVRSPDRKYSAFVKNQNVYLRNEEDGGEHELSTDGREGNAYARLEWSPDSTALVAWRIEPGERKEVHLLQSSPPGGGRAVLHSRPYALPGDKFTSHELSVFNVAERKQVKPEIGRVDFGSPRLRWEKEGCRFTFQKIDRGHQRFRLIEVNARSGETRNLIDEQTRTFIWTAHTENVNIPLVTWLERSGEILHVSEQSGWRHAYLIDPRVSAEGEQGSAEGAPRATAITRGEWVLRGIDRIDEEKRELWFRASGVYPGQDPYLIHHGRVKFDGSDLVWLTAGNGQHSIAYSPDKRFLIATYNRVDLAPVNELRRVADGTLVCELERADDAELRATGWEPPEVFMALGRDGKTEIWGLIHRPRNLDPNRKYPVLEDIYAGPQGSFVPKTFSPQRRYESYTNLGFIVAKIDGMGTANRSKAFHDACWQNLKDAGFEDRILWHRAVAAKYPYYDVSRVGIYGTSAGGQNAAGAVIFHGDFYKAAVANCGCHDNRLDKASWNEQWMGYPVGEQYSQSSNIDNAHKLGGKLMLVVGEMDNNVPPESTYRLVDALVRANKDFDFLLIPNGGHGAGGQYVQRRMQEFFTRHLQGREPAARAAPRR